MKRTLVIAAMLLFMNSEWALALDVAGVTVPDTVVTDTSEHELVLNGAGIRKKFFIKIYIGALYLPSKSNAVESILNMEGAKRVTMHFLHSKVSVEKIVEGWNSGFSGNLSPQELETLQDRLNQFNGLFRTVHKGDLIRLDFIPDQGTHVWINQENRGTIQGDDFYRALLNVWLGSKPADSGLKEAMLGKTE